MCLPISLIIFTVTALNPFPGRLPSSTRLFSEVLSCFSVWNTLLCHLVLLSCLYFYVSGRLVTFSHLAAKSLQSCPISVRPHRRQPTRLPCPWDSPGKNTGVGCHFLLQCMKVKRESEVAQSCPTSTLEKCCFVDLLGVPTAHSPLITQTIRS